MEHNFVDQIRVYLRSGKGGSGAIHFHRDKLTAFGGPDGGDGGRGGHIILKGNSHLWTLLHLRYKKHIFAGDGENGKGGNSTGKNGKDVIVEVPLGCVVKDEHGKVLAEVLNDGEEIILLKGGRGGKGNAFFKTDVRQSPKFAQEGESGTEGWFTLELKILADVGLVGFPNAGKSTLLASISAAKPEIADYPFTTLVPNLGIVPYKDYQSFIMADIPGIIEGAHEGRGLGLRFLRHIERNSVLLFMVSAENANVWNEYKILLNELKAYSPELMKKRRILAITKSDILDTELMREMEKEIKAKNKGKNKIPFIFISSVTGYHLDKLKDLIWQELHDHS
ncbi:MAG: GTPase ObgE [Bacteroidia bacterium]|nr:GTPase ObgE [Bacteroidia bacterium]